MNADVLPRIQVSDLRVRNAIAALVARFPGTAWNLSGDTRQFRKSRVVFLTTADGAHRAGLKLYADTRAAKRQGEALLYGAAVDRQRGHAVPALYHLDAEAGALLVEWLDAPHLEAVLIRSALSPARHRRTLERVGAWLRDFHSAGRIEPGPFEAERYRAQFAARIAGAEAGAGVLRADSLWGRSCAWLERRLERLDGTPVPSGCTHGDFTFTNVLVTPETVTGIDIWAEPEVPLVEDLARMFVYLAMGDPFPLRARVASVPLAARRAQQALLLGYGGLDAASASVWETMVCHEALARWLALSDRLARRGSFSERWKCTGLRGVLTSIVGRG